MRRKLPPYVSREKSRHGKTVYYFRRFGKRSRLPDYADDSFQESYIKALSGWSERQKTKASPQSLNWLLSQYRLSSAYLSLSKATRKQRDNIFKPITDRSGNISYRSITQKNIVAGREHRAATPSQARNYLDAMRGLFRWALESQHVDVDPTASVKNPRRNKGPGFPAWTEDDAARYEAFWPIGSKERVWLHVLLYTGLRRGDAVLIGRQHVKNGVAALRTEKNNTELNIVISEPLADALAIGPTGDMAWICGERGQPLAKESFGNMFSAACRKAGIVKSAHGLRKLAATTAAEAGLTVAELEAMFGWTGGAMASHYTRTANRKALAAMGAEKIKNKNCRTK